MKRDIDGVSVNRRTVRQSLITSRRSEWSDRDISKLQLMPDSELLAAVDDSRVDIPDDAVETHTADASALYGDTGSVLVQNVNRSDRSIATGSSRSGKRQSSNATVDLSGWENRAGKRQVSNATDGVSGWENRASERIENSEDDD